jgi:maltose/moltooligosaccharide transporter
VLYTGFTVKEMPPQEYAKYNNIQPADNQQKVGLLKLLANAPKAFWQIGLVQFFCWFAFLYMWNYTTGGIAENVWGVDTALKSSTATPEYQAAGDWCGVLFAVQSIGSILWAMVLPMFKRVKVGYSVSLIIGAIGFVLCFFVHDQYMMFVPFLLIGCAWAAMLAMPFALLTNALSGSSSMGAYLGLFNCTICLPQIVAALLGGVIMGLVGGTQVMMLVVSGVCLLLGSVAVAGIKTKA